VSRGLAAGLSLFALALLPGCSREPPAPDQANGAAVAGAVGKAAGGVAPAPANAAAAAKPADPVDGGSENIGDVGPDARPAAGSAQRAAIMDALRPSVERELGGPVEFVVDRAEVRDGWALVIANPQRPGGGGIDASDYFPSDQLESMDGLTISAILRFSGNGWTVVDHKIGATDVWYCDPEVGAPHALTGC
jgi:hypothetical protein